MMDLRRLDVLIAEHVLEWKKGIVLIPNFNTPFWINGEQRVFLPDIPRFSEEIEAAWQVRMKMREEGFWFLVTDNDRGVTASFDHDDGRGGSYKVASPDEEPLAICMAAMEAKGKGVEVPEE